jgi:translation initiation factor IF-2
VEVEIKRKKHGLMIDKEERNSNYDKISTKSENSVNLGNLTDQEFKARVKALQNAMKEEIESSIASAGQYEQEDASIEEPIVDNREIIKNREYSAPITKAKQSSKPENNWKKTTKPIIENIGKPSHSSSGSQTHVVFRANNYGKESPKRANTPFEKEKTARTIPDQNFQGLNKPHPARTKSKTGDESTETPVSRKKTKVVVKEKAFPKKAHSSGKISRAMLDRVLNNDLEERTRSEASFKRARMKLKNSASREFETAKVIREVLIPDSITISELANRMAIRSAEIIKYLMNTGTIATVNQTINGDTAEVICSEFKHIPKRVSDSDIENEIENIVDDPKDMIIRAPIVAIMGHVDHGKTTLLDTLRNTNIVQKEAGGITQHIAAYQIETKQGKKITFIDTPGHAAFSKIRERGAVITDIIILVVAADDGIKEQTIEVIRQAKAQKVPIVVAINKVDKPDINIDRVKTELMAQEIVLEEFGGDILSAEISALKSINLDGLLDSILLQAEILELKANPDRIAVGTVIESRIDKGVGIISSVIIQSGTIRIGDSFVAGASFGKVRTIYDDKKNKLTSAEPAAPIELIGFNSSPEPGDVLHVIETEQKAREIAEYRKSLNKSSYKKVPLKSMEQLMSGSHFGLQELKIIVKADVFGSLEALVASLELIQNPEIKLKIVDKGIGAISETDIDFAKNIDAIVVGFNVNITTAAKNSSKFYNVKVIQQNVIYRITEEVKKIAGAMLSPIVEENYIGNADVRKIFMISRYGTIAGCYVSDGIVKRTDSKIKVIRDGKLIFEGKIKSMKHEKDEIKEARQNYECGILAEGYNDFEEGDQIECYEIILKRRSMD